MGEHEDCSRYEREEFGALWYWMIRTLIVTAPYILIILIALVTYRVLFPPADQLASVISLGTGLFCTGTVCGLVAGHLREDRLLRRELISRVEELTRAPGDRPLRLLKSDPLSPGAHVAPSPRRTPQ